MKGCVRKWLTEQVGVTDEAVLASLYEDYRATLKEQCRQMRADLSAGDFAGLNRTAHTLKGTALTVGDVELLPAVLALRDAAKAEDADGAAREAARLGALVAQV